MGINTIIVFSLCHFVFGGWASLVIRRPVQKVTSPEKKYCFGAKDTLAMHAKGALKSGSVLAAPIGQGLGNGKKERHGKSW
jgi:hypothetical protein